MNVSLAIDYVEDIDGYMAVVLTAPGGEPVRYNTQDPVADWAEACADADALVKGGHATGCSLRSSCIQFVFDVPGYRWTPDDKIELDPADWTDGVLTPANYGFDEDDDDDDEDENIA